MERIIKDFRPAQPVGYRSGFARFDPQRRERNRWQWQADMRDEMERFWRNELDPKMLPAEYEDYRAQLKFGVAKGKSATLYVSERSQGAEARVIHDLLLELRPLLNDDRPVFGRQKRALRLYYGEPATLDNVLLGLHLATKEASSSGLQEQDVSIGVAKERAHNWAQAQ